MKWLPILALLCVAAAGCQSRFSAGTFVEDRLTHEVGMVRGYTMGGNVIVRFKDGRTDVFDQMELYGTHDPRFDE